MNTQTHLVSHSKDAGLNQTFQSNHFFSTKNGAFLWS